MTGRAAGYCAGFATPGFANGYGRGFGGGRGFGRGGGRGGRGRRNWFYATGLTGWQRAAMGYAGFGAAVPPAGPVAAPFAPAMGAEQQLDALKGQAEHLEGALEGIRKRIEELEAASKKEAPSTTSQRE